MKGKDSSTRIVIDPRSSYSYGSFYIYGLTKLYGKGNVRFSMQPFKGLPDLGNSIRFVAINKSVSTKFHLHLDDDYKIHMADYKWCDVYGNVNANFKETSKNDFPKLVSLVPSFGIKAFSDISVLSMALHNFLIAMPSILKRKEWNKYTNSMETNCVRNIKHYFGRIYKTNKNRVELSEYDPPFESDDNYVFFCSTLWYSNIENQNDTGVNLQRANFMRVCKSFSELVFEGGFVADDTSSKDKFKDLLTSGVSMSDWIAKTKKSAFVFNTPAFWNCHGWKLGEYLALGKCIISTPIYNDLPAPLVHGEHIHFVEPNIDSIRDAITYIMSNKNYRVKLEQNARAYWEKYGTPENSLRLIGL